MNNRYVSALISASLSIFPMIAIILILSFSGIANINSVKADGSIDYTNTFLIIVGLFVLVIGLALFEVGTATGLTKVGEYMGISLSKQKNLFIVIVFAFALGTLITCAEPSILILSKQVMIIDDPLMNTVLIVGGIALGAGVFVLLGVLRVIFHKSIKMWYVLFYAIIFMIASLIAIDPDKRKLLPFIFDSGGVTTGSATVPFILALGAGVAMVRGGKNATQDSFGLVGMASIGPIISMSLLILIKSNVPEYSYPTMDSNGIFMKFMIALLPIGGTLGSMVEVLIALAPILIIFFIYNALFVKLPRHQMFKLLIGFGISYLGLVAFLSATSAAMMPVGYIVGESLGGKESWIIAIIAFIIGSVTILCEPAVHVLTVQIETISDGRIKKPTVLFTLSLGVGTAIFLVAIRTIFNFSILYYVVPGYALCLILTLFCPDIFVAMAFDSGGTSSGPMSSSFVLPMIVGITKQRGLNNGIPIGNIDFYGQAFGAIAMITMSPIIAIQILGIIGNVKSYRAKKAMAAFVYSKEDAQIIVFD